ncbi:MAG TPA: hypothetical protein VMH92_12505 [Acidocella sp.]|nr:hypothetical protein [Acidocella sp.]
MAAALFLQPPDLFTGQSYRLGGDAGCLGLGEALRGDQGGMPRPNPNTPDTSAGAASPSMAAHPLK